MSASSLPQPELCERSISTPRDTQTMAQPQSPLCTEKVEHTSDQYVSIGISSFNIPLYSYHQRPKPVPCGKPLPCSLHEQAETQSGSGFAPLVRWEWSETVKHAKPDDEKQPQLVGEKV